MSITSNDIAAQRAMLERGEEKRKADWRQAERERLRDTFAAAALTGLLSNIQTYQLVAVTRQAYDLADEMIVQRDRYNADAVVPERSKGDMAGCSPVESDASYLPCPRRGDTGVAAGSNPADSNHDAAPEACVQQSTWEPERSLLAQSESVERGLPRTGNTPSKAEIDALEFVVEEGRTASVDDYGILRSWLIRLRPEWESQSCEESDEKRTNTTMNRDATSGEGSVRGEGTAGERLVERVLITQAMLDDNEKLQAENDQLREAIRRLATQDATLSVRGGNVTVTMDATLTDDELAALTWFAHYGLPEHRAAALRNLLERLK